MVGRNHYLILFITTAAATTNSTAIYAENLQREGLEIVLAFLYSGKEDLVVEASGLLKSISKVF